MTKTQKKKWLNSACLGHCGTGVPRHIHTGNMSISDTFEKLRRWVIEWTQFANGKVGFLDSTTAACDAVLLSLAADAETYLYTSSAHPTIRHSVITNARIAAHMRRRSTDVHEIDLTDIPLNSSSDVAHEVVDRVVYAAGGRPTVFVLEHVTYDHGLRLPVDHVVNMLAERSPNIKVIIDGAQAVGLWRPQGAAVTAYIGCFHKYVAGPPATGFVVIDERWSEWLPPHVQPVCKPHIALGLLPTIDLEKWMLATQVVFDKVSIGGLNERLKRMTEFNRNLDEALAPFAISLGPNHGPDLRSHISTLVFESEIAATTVETLLETNGLFVQRFENLIRISAGLNTNSKWATEAGTIVTGATATPRNFVADQRHSHPV